MDYYPTRILAFKKKWPTSSPHSLAPHPSLKSCCFLFLLEMLLLNYKGYNCKKKYSLRARARPSDLKGCAIDNILLMQCHMLKNLSGNEYIHIYKLFDKIGHYQEPLVLTCDVNFLIKTHVGISLSPKSNILTVWVVLKNIVLLPLSGVHCVPKYRKFMYSLMNVSLRLI